MRKVMRIRCLFFKTRRGPWAKKSEKHWYGLYSLYTYGAKCWVCVLISLSNDKFKSFIKEEHQYWKGLCSIDIQRTHKTSFPVTPLLSLLHFSYYSHYHANARMYLCWLQLYNNASICCSGSKTVKWYLAICSNDF
jgi:hypothetical protein